MNQFSRIIRLCQTELGMGIFEPGDCKAIDNMKTNHISLDCTMKENKKCRTFNEEAIIPCLQKSDFYGKKYFRSVLAIPCDGIRGYKTFQAQDSSLDFATPEFSTLNFSIRGSKNLGRGHSNPGLFNPLVKNMSNSS